MRKRRGCPTFATFSLPLSSLLSCLHGSMAEPPSLDRAVCDIKGVIVPGAQTERRGDAGAVRLLLWPRSSPARLSIAYKATGSETAYPGYDIGNKTSQVLCHRPDHRACRPSPLRMKA